MSGHSAWADVPRSVPANPARVDITQRIAAVHGVWRTGRRNPRNIYHQVGHAPSDNDVCIGMLDSGTLARDACEAHNARLTKADA